MSNEPTQPAQETLEDLLFKYCALYERWGEDRKELAKQSAEITKLVNRFAAQLDKFKDLDQEIKRQISTSIRQAANEMSSQASKEFIERISKDVKAATQDLERGVEKATDKLKEYYYQEKFSKLWYAAICYVMPILVSLLLVWIMMPKPTLPLTDQQLNTYQEGQFLHQFWSKLSKKEQDRLTNLATGSSGSSSNSDETNNNDDSSADNQ